MLNKLKKGSIVFCDMVVPLAIMVCCLFGVGQYLSNNNKNIIKKEEYNIINVEALETYKTSDIKYGIYVWDWKQTLDENSDEFLNNMLKHNINAVYICFDSKNWTTNLKDTNNFMEKMVENNIKVYALNGDPSWYNSLAKQREIWDPIINYNKTAKYPILGMMIDIEPAGTDAWRKDEPGTLKIYAETMKETYDYLKENNMEVWLCIPTWFDEVDLNTCEDIIKNSCDGISVMNYWHEHQTEAFKNEYDFALKYDKYINTVSEFGNTGNDGSCYYNKNFEDCYNDWNELKEDHDYNKLSFGFHYYTILKERFW